MTAEMAFQTIFSQMKGKGYAAVRAFANVTALIAKERGGKSTPVKEQDRLLLFCETRLDRGRQTIRDQRQMLLFEILLAHVDNSDQGKLPVIHPRR